MNRAAELWIMHDSHQSIRGEDNSAPLVTPEAVYGGQSTSDATEHLAIGILAGYQGTGIPSRKNEPVCGLQASWG
jgi:hypothetical protein